MRRTILLMLAFVVSYTSALSSSGDKLLKDFQNYSEDQRVAVYWCCVLILVDSFVLLILTWFTLYFSYSYTGCQFMTLFLFQFTH